jgi:hypothetical protein
LPLGERLEIGRGFFVPVFVIYEILLWPCAGRGVLLIIANEIRNECRFSIHMALQSGRYQSGFLEAVLVEYGRNHPLLHAWHL